MPSLNCIKNYYKISVRMKRYVVPGSIHRKLTKEKLAMFFSLIYSFYGSYVMLSKLSRQIKQKKEETNQQQQHKIVKWYNYCLIVDLFCGTT